MYRYIFIIFLFVTTLVNHNLFAIETRSMRYERIVETYNRWEQSQEDELLGELWRIIREAFRIPAHLGNANTYTAEIKEILYKTLKVSTTDENLEANLLPIFQDAWESGKSFFKVKDVYEVLQEKALVDSLILDKLADQILDKEFYLSRGNTSEVFHSFLLLSRLKKSSDESKSLRTSQLIEHLSKHDPIFAMYRHFSIGERGSTFENRVYFYGIAADHVRKAYDWEMKRYKEAEKLLEEGKIAGLGSAPNYNSVLARLMPMFQRLVMNNKEEGPMVVEFYSNPEWQTKGTRGKNRWEDFVNTLSKNQPKSSKASSFCGGNLIKSILSRRLRSL